MIFVVPLKSKTVTLSWDYTSKLLERCLHSICNQTSADLKVIVACHEKPDVSFCDSRVKYVSVNYSPPDKLDYNAKRLDKVQKVAVGLRVAQEYDFSHAMIVDADDCVHREVASFVNAHQDEPGWYIDKGYRYIDRRKRILPIDKDFDKICATSIIVKPSVYNLPTKIDYDPVRYNSLLKNFIWHSKAKQHLLDQNIYLKPLPFRGAIYIEPSNKDSLFNQRGLLNKFIENPKMLVSPLKKSLFYFTKSNLFDDRMQLEFNFYPLA